MRPATSAATAAIAATAVLLASSAAVMAAPTDIGRRGVIELMDRLKIKLDLTFKDEVAASGSASASAPAKVAVEPAALHAYTTPTAVESTPVHPSSTHVLSTAVTSITTYYATAKSTTATTTITISTTPAPLQTVTSIQQCPLLTPRTSKPTNVRDLRIDDFSAIWGIGDSVQAGFGARISTPKDLLKTNPLYEYRGANFATGGDPDSLSLGNLMLHYNPTLKGLSHGNRLFDFCYGPICAARHILPDNVPVQGLNAAESGAWVDNWPNQMGYLNTHLRTVDPQAGSANHYTLISLVMGFNDLCLGCFNWTAELVFEADKYESNMRSMLQAIRGNFTNVVVSVVTPFNMSQIHTLTEKDTYCRIERKVLFVECLCLLEEHTRQRMDKLAIEYAGRMAKLADEFNGLNDPGFAIAYDPGMRGLDMAAGPITLMSREDCFHPSKLAHDLIGQSIWNNLFRAQNARLPYDINYQGYVCPTESSRVMIN